MSTLDVAQAQVRLSELIHDANEGEEIVIADEDGTAVRLVPVEPQARPRFGSARGLFTMSDDFDAPLDDFAPYER
jgi:antitoxin (DNA-binding transcriptional repressor) of toxin-antitoxin stability system